MENIIRFRAVIEDAGGGGAFVSVPFDVEQTFGKKRVKIKATIEGQVYRGSLVRMGTGCHILGVRKDIRAQIGKGIGEEVEVTVEEDTEAREVTLPADLAAALQRQPEAQAFYRQLAYTHQKAYVAWVEQAKREQTRLSRVEQAVQLLKEGQKEP